MNTKKVIILCDEFYPSSHSASSLNTVLAEEFSKNGYSVSVICTKGQCDDPRLLLYNKIKISRINSYGGYSKKYLIRFLSELLASIKVIPLLKKYSYSPYGNKAIIVWLSPTIFFGVTMLFFNKNTFIKRICLTKDLFPDWCIDLGIIKNSFVKKVIVSINKLQLIMADVICLQSANNKIYFDRKYPEFSFKSFVVNNWHNNNFSNLKEVNSKTHKKRYKIIYCGNLGVAQNINNLVKFLYLCNSVNRFDVKLFLNAHDQAVVRKFGLIKTYPFVEVYKFVSESSLSNLVCDYDFGLVFLHEKHTTHNIPGKYLFYIKNGLKVLGYINDGNDIIDDFKIIGGCNFTNCDNPKAIKILTKIKPNSNSESLKSRNFYLQKYSIHSSFKQILNCIKKF